MMKVAFKIWRYSAATGERALKEYEIDAPEEATLLDCLDIAKDRHDGTLAYRKSCRMMICGSCGMRMDGAAVLACKTRMYDIAQAGQIPTISAMGNLPIVKDLVVDMDPFWAKFKSVQPWLQPGFERPNDGREYRISQERMNVDQEGVALHQLRLLRLGVQRDGVRPRVPRPAGAREGHALRRRPARRRDGRAARELQQGARHLGLHALLLLQRALPEGRRPARRDREARRRGDRARHRPRPGREAREVVRPLVRDDRLAPRGGADPEDERLRRRAQGAEVRRHACAAREGAPDPDPAHREGRQRGA